MESLTAFSSSFIANLSDLQATAISWGGGIVVIALIIFMVIMFIKKNTREALVTLAFAVLVMAVIVGANTWFGPNGTVTGIGKKIGDQVNVN